MLKRKTRLRAHTPLRRKQAMRSKPAVPRSRPPEYVDPEFIAWLKRQPCRVTGKAGPNEAHHLRHSAAGAALGKNMKDDTRAITLSFDVHVPQLHGNAGFFKDWGKYRIRAWENAQLAIQRAQYLAWKAKQEATPLTVGESFTFTNSNGS